jgi:HEAT repeat protein
MALNLAQKKEVVAEVADVAAKAHSMVASEYIGLSVAQLTELAMPGAFFRKKATAHRVAAVQALAETRKPEAIKTLQQLDDDKDPAVRAAVVQAMTSLRAAARSAS